MNLANIQQDLLLFSKVSVRNAENPITRGHTSPHATRDSSRARGRLTSRVDIPGGTETSTDVIHRCAVASSAVTLDSSSSSRPPSWFGQCQARPCREGCVSAGCPTQVSFAVCTWRSTYIPFHLLPESINAQHPHPLPRNGSHLRRNHGPCGHGRTSSGK